MIQQLSTNDKWQQHLMVSHSQMLESADFLSISASYRFKMFQSLGLDIWSDRKGKIKVADKIRDSQRVTHNKMNSSYICLFD